MANRPDQIEYRGWRVKVETPLGFFALVLFVAGFVLSGLALRIPRFQGLLVKAVIAVVLGLPLLVALLMVHSSTPLDGVSRQVRSERKGRRRQQPVRPEKKPEQRP